MSAQKTELVSSTDGPDASIANGVTGTLVGFTADSSVPLVTFSGQFGTAAVAARSTVDLFGGHIGREVLLVCERGDPRLPIVVGVLGGTVSAGMPEIPPHVELDADGARLVVKASEQIVLRCGKASITLTKAGKVLLEGTYVLSRSSGVNRIRGGSVQIN